MRRFACVVLAGMLISLLMVSLVSAEMAEIKVGKGTLKMGGILQAGYTYNLEDAAGIDQFTLNRARFLLWGDIVPDKVKYFVQTETNGSPAILDYKARFFYIPKTEITVGRFLPNFTLYMPYSTAKLEMINYPLTTAAKVGGVWYFAPWRQVGIQTTTKTEYVDFNVGIFNGGDQPNNKADNNDAKDFLLRAEVKPPVEGAKIRVGGYAWLGKANPNIGTTEETIDRNRFGGFAKADYKATEKLTLKFRGEFLMASTDEVLGFTVDTNGVFTIDSTATTDGQAFFVHLGIQPDPRFEFLVRYDCFDPNTDQEYEADVTADDKISWLTIGANYYLEGLNSMFYLNYISKKEDGKNADGTDREIDNDLVVAQVQILF